MAWFTIPNTSGDDSGARLPGVRLPPPSGLLLHAHPTQGSRPGLMLWSRLRRSRPMLLNASRNRVSLNALLPLAQASSRPMPINCKPETDHQMIDSHPPRASCQRPALGSDLGTERTPSRRCTPARRGCSNGHDCPSDSTRPWRRALTLRSRPTAAHVCW